MTEFIRYLIFILTFQAVCMWVLILIINHSLNKILGELEAEA